MCHGSLFLLKCATYRSISCTYGDWCSGPYFEFSDCFLSLSELAALVLTSLHDVRVRWRVSVK